METDKPHPDAPNTSQRPLVIICGQYRSGSTLLLRLFNEHPNVRINGENNGAVERLVQYFSLLARLPQTENYSQQALDPTWFPAWYNCFDYERIRNSLRNLIFLQCAASSGIIGGYKEIRHGLPRTLLLDEFAEALLAILGGEVRFVLLTRSVEEMISSIRETGWEDDPEGFRDELIFQQKAFERLALNNPHHCRLVTYEDLINNTPNLAATFEFAGINFSPDAWKRVIAVRISR